MTIKPNVIFIINRSQFLKFIKIIGFVSLFCGGAALILYFHYLGGLIVALSMAEYARSLAYDMGDILSPSQVRLIVIARLIILSAFCYIILYKFNKTKFNKVCIIISIVITYIFLLFNASRTIIGIYSVALIFPILSKYCRHPWQIIFVISIVGLNGLNLLDSLFSSFSSNSEFNVAEFKYNEIIMQFSFAYRNVLHSFNIMNEFGCRYFLDLITSFLNFIPGVTFQSSIEPTSIYFGGPYWRKMGGIPNDVVTYSILEGGIIGVILFPIFIGRILKRADNSLSSLIGSDKKSNIAKIVKPYLMMSVFFCVPSADLQSIIGNYTVFIFSFALCYFSKRKQLQNS